jgi:solute carrier family 25 aspartate/glutamate transporter 12/13
MQNASKFTNGATGTAAVEYTGVLDCIQKLYKINGVSTFYSGLRPTLVGILPEKAIKLAANDFFRSYYGALYMSKSLDEYRKDRNELDKQLPLWVEASAGGSAGLFQVVATNPMELIKIRRQLTPVSTMDIIKELGLSGMYSKVHATLLRDIPFSMLYFTLYSRLKKQFTNKETGELTHGRVFTASVIAGATAAFFSTPLDVIKTRVQARNTPYKGVYDCATRIAREEGYKTFLNGATARVTTISLLFGFTLIFYEYQKHLLQEYLHL